MVVAPCDQALIGHVYDESGHIEKLRNKSPASVVCLGVSVFSENI